MLAKLDKWLISRVFQGIVDLSQRQPAWWVRQAAGLAVLSVAAEFVFRPGRGFFDWLGLIAVIVMCGYLCLLSLSPSLMAELMVDWNWLRMVYAVMAVADLISAVLAPSERHVAGAFVMGSLAAMLYFAACEPPRPREPRRKMAGQGV
jgi:hypothetical protein